MPKENPDEVSQDTSVSQNGFQHEIELEVKGSGKADLEKRINS